VQLVVNVKNHERSALILSFLYFFFVLSAYYVIRPVRDQLGAVGGSASLVGFYAATFVTTLIVTPVFGAMVARWPRKQFVPAVYGFFILCLVGFVPLFKFPTIISYTHLGAIFFVWASVFNLFVVSIFWSFMADIFTAEQARRLFSIIALGGTLGALVGPLVTRELVAHIGIAYLLLVSAMLLGMSLLCILGLIAWSSQYSEQTLPQLREQPIGGSIWAGAKQLFTSPFLRRMAILMLLGDAIGTVLYGLVSDYVKAMNMQAEERTAFYATMDLVTNGLQIFFQLTLTRWLLAQHGAGITLVVPTIINMVLLLTFAVLGGVWLLAALVVSRAGAYGIVKPASDSLYTRVEREARYKGKNFIDTAIWRFGDLVLINALGFLRSLGAGIPVFGLLCASAALASGWVGWRAAHSKDLAPEAQPKKSLSKVNT